MPKQRPTSEMKTGPPTDLLDHRDGFVLELHQTIRWNEYVSTHAPMRCCYQGRHLPLLPSTLVLSR